MKYIIMSAGKGTRWNHYLGISKQEVIINGESLLERTVRLIRENDCNSEIIISSNNEAHKVNGTVLHNPTYFDNYRRKYCYELVNEPLIYLYGDTFYEKESIHKIILPNNKDVIFYGNSRAIVGIRVNDFVLFKKALSEYSGNASLFNYFKKVSEYDKKNRFQSIGNEFFNINCATDYEKLKKVEEELFYNNKLLCSGIIWNIGLSFQNDIIEDISKRYDVNNIYSIDLEEEYFEFLSMIYDDYLSEQSIENKCYLMCDTIPKVVVCNFEINNPHFLVQSNDNNIICVEIEKIKKLLLKMHHDLPKTILDNSVHITNTPIEYLNNTETIAHFMKKSHVKTLKLR